ncbi:MAG: thioredoxin domain-containing protein [archaeon]
MAEENETKPNEQPQGTHHDGHKRQEKKGTNPWLVVSSLLAVAVIILVVYLVMVQIKPVVPDNGNGNNGASTGKVLVEEFSDFQCPACGNYFPLVEQFRKDYAGKITFVYRHYPLSYHQFAQKSAEASECARDQGKFEEYYKRLFEESIRAYGAGEKEPKLAVPDLKAYAKQLGLDSAKFDSCLDSGRKASEVQTDRTEGTKRGVGGTPTFYFNGTEFSPQSIQDFKDETDRLLAKPSGATDTNSPDPEFNMIEIDDDSCTVCNQNRLPLLLASGPFPSAKLVKYGADSAEGKKFISDYNLDTLPAFLLDKRAEGAKNFAQIGSYLQKKGGYYVFPYSLMDQISSQAGPLYTARRMLSVSVPLEGAPMLGNANAKVKFIAFEDYQCPFCKRYEGETTPKLKENYIDSNKIAYYFKDYQFLGPDSTTAGNAGQCAYEQGNGLFWQFVSMMYLSKQGPENGGWASESNIKTYVKDLNGLDQNKFGECLSSKKYSDKVSASLAFGQSLGGFGTPTLFINNIQVQGAHPYDTFKKIIDDELAARG